MQKFGACAGIALLALAALAGWSQNLLVGGPSGRTGGSSAGQQAEEVKPLRTAATSATRSRSGWGTTTAAHAATRHVRSDIDGDGRSDLLLENRSFNYAAYWIMDGATPVRYSPAFVPPIDHVQVATGDFNGDAKLDIVWARSSAFTGPVRPPGSAPPTKLVMWLGDGNGFASVNIGDNAEGWAVVGAGDIDGDRKSDLLLLNASLGYVAYWTMDGPQVTGYSAVFARPADSVLSATGDFNGDGKLDLVWENPLTGSVMWLGAGGGFSQQAVDTGASTFAVIGSGDIDGDGKDDLLLFDSFGYFYYRIMDGATVVRASPGFVRPEGYSRVIPGDFDGDGKLDMIWERGADRSMLFWKGNGGVGYFSGVAFANYAPHWQIHSQARRAPPRGDVDGDGRSDLLLVNDSLGLHAYWAMNGARVIRYSQAFANPDGHRPLFAGEFTGDGLLDIVWFRDTDRNVVLGKSDGAGFNAIPLGRTDGKEPFASFKYYQGYDRDTLYLYDRVFDRNTYWRIGDTQVFLPAFSGTNNPTQPAGWTTLVGVGNFDSDSRSDTVVASTTDRTLLVRGTAVLSSRIGPVAAGWAVVGTGDIDGDGGSDLILENAEGIAYWIMRNAVPVRYSPGFLKPSGYRRAAMADYNGDGKLDIVWARESDRSLLLWQGDGEGFTQASIGNYTAGWRVFGNDSAIRYPVNPP